MDAHRVAMNLQLRHGSEVLLRTDFSLGQDGRVILGGPSYRDGVLLIWVGAHHADGARGHGAQGVRPTVAQGEMR